MCSCPHTRFACPQGTARIQVAIANTARCPENKRKCEGTVREGLLQVGLQSFLQRVLHPNETPRHQETLRNVPKMSQNAPKWGPWGGSWESFCHFLRSFWEPWKGIGRLLGCFFRRWGKKLPNRSVLEAKVAQRRPTWIPQKMIK